MTVVIVLMLVLVVVVVVALCRIAAQADEVADRASLTWTGFRERGVRLPRGAWRLRRAARVAPLRCASPARDSAAGARTFP